MSKIIRSRTILWVTIILTIFIILLATGCFMETSFSVTNNLKTNNVTNETNELQEELNGNISKISNLTTQINGLNKEILELEFIIDQKNSENEKLEKQIHELNDCLDQIDAELKSMSQIEEISNLVQRLRNPPLESTEIP